MDAKKPITKQPVFWLVGIAGFIILSFATFITGAVTLYQLHIVMPAQAYETVLAGEWKAMNPRVMDFRNDGDFERAENLLLEHQLKESKNGIETNYLMGSIHQYMDRDDEAIAYYTQSLELIESSWYQKAIYTFFKEDIHASLALIYYNNKKPKAALAELNAMEDLENHQDNVLLTAMKDCLEEPNRADYHFLFGKELTHSLMLEDARAEIQLAEKLSTDPGLKLQIHNHLKSKMPARTKDLSPLIRYYTLAGDYFEYSEEYQDLDKAAYYYKRVIYAEPEFEWGYHQLSNIYLDQEDYPKAKEYASKAVALNPNFYLAHLTMGDIELDRENYSTATRHFKDALAIVSTMGDQTHVDLSANIENQLGFSYESLDQSREAMAHYEKALKLATRDSDDYIYAREALQRMKELL